MKGKNRKRIGPVPITLVAVFALAAFLSVGLLIATNGVQPVAAQSADCEVTIANAEGTAVTVPSEACKVQGDTATVVFKGSADGEDDVTVSLLIEDTAGPITAYPSGTVWNALLTTPGLADGAAADSTPVTADAIMRYRFESVTVPEAEANPTTGIVEGQKVSVMLKGNFHVWAGSVSVTGAIAAIPDGDAATGARAIAADAEVVTFTFLGTPAIGVDGDDDGDIVNGAEIRSNLGSSTALDGAAAAVNKVVTDGGSVNHIISGDQEGATITATVMDADASPLGGVEVTFTATSEPVGIESSTRVVDTLTTGIATRTISGLPAKGPYMVSVEVTVGSLNLGTIVIQKAGSLHEVTATTCVDDDENDAKDDGCGADNRPSNVFKPEDTFEIKAKALDTLGIDTAIEPTIDFGDAQTLDGEDAETEGGLDIFSGTFAAVMIDTDAPQGRYNLTVKATSGTGDSQIDRETTVEVIISGEISSYGISGSDSIALAPFSSEEYTISGMDSLGNPPIFAEDEKEDEVTVLVESALNPRISGLDDGKVTLNPETGQAKITIFKPADAEQGDTIHIGILVNGELVGSKVITFGEPVGIPSMLGDASGLMAVAGADAGMVELTWTPGPNATRHFVAGVKQSDLDAGTAGDSLIWTAADNPGSHTVTGLDSGEVYIFFVIAGDADGWGAWTALQMVTPS